jgi:Transposase, Mutator family
VELESYGQLQQDGKLQRAVRERLVAGLSTRNYRRAVESVLEGYGIEKSSVSRQFVEASSNQLRVLCERRLADLNLVVLMIDGIHFGGQVLVVALGIAESGEKHVLGVWQGLISFAPTLYDGAAGGNCKESIQALPGAWRSRLNSVAGSLTVPNIESRCNQLKLGHPRASRGQLSLCAKLGRNATTPRERLLAPE